MKPKYNYMSGMYEVFIYRTLHEFDTYEGAMEFYNNCMEDYFSDAPEPEGWLP